VIRLDAATVLLQWATGGLFFLWFTTRRREVGLGYGWLLRGVYGVIAAGAVFVGLRYGTVVGREIASAGVAAAAFVALGVSIARKRAGVSGQQTEHDRRSARVAAMTGIERAGRDDGTLAGPERSGGDAARPPAEFPPVLDLVAPAIGLIGLIIAAAQAGADTSAGGAWDVTVALLRTVAGAAFLGAVTDAMLLGHWYLVQPGLPRRHLQELVTAVGVTWPVEVGALLLPTGMVSVWLGTVDDGWKGTLGWFWGASAITTIALVLVTKAALRERAYSAVMAATGLLYLAILTGFGTDLVARAVLAR
jgi:hypothetical protein